MAGTRLRGWLFDFLRAVGLEPIDWSEALRAARGSSPTIESVLKAGLGRAQAVVVLFTGDDVARLGTRYLTVKEPDHERRLTAQARQNVVFEAGLALALFPARTILVQLGDIRPFSDIAGRFIIRISDRREDRRRLIDELRKAKCLVKLPHGDVWARHGSFDAAQTQDADEASDQWNYRHPLHHEGLVWIRIEPLPEHRGMQHEVEFRWGRLERSRETILVDDAINLTHKKLQKDELPLSVFVQPKCKVTFGQNDPPPGPKRSIDHGWKSAD